MTWGDTAFINADGIPDSDLKYGEDFIKANKELQDKTRARLNPKLKKAKQANKPSFRMQQQKFLLTWAKADWLLEPFATKLFSMYPGAVHVLVCAEKHLDGTPHRHAYIEYKSKHSFRDPRHFDIDGFHANISPVNNRAACIKYIKKHATDPFPA